MILLMCIFAVLFNDIEAFEVSFVVEMFCLRLRKGGRPVCGLWKLATCC